MAKQSRSAPCDPSHPLWPDIVPRNENRNDSANATRLLFYFGKELVITLPGETDSGDAEAEIYGITSAGMLSRRRAQALVKRAGKQYADACKRELGEHHPDYQRCLEHANQLKGKFAFAAVQRMMTAVVVDLLEEGLLSPDVVVKRKDEIDSDLTCIGTPSGVLELTTGRILPPDEARKRLVLSNTGVEYDPEARHPKVDEILPPIGPDMARNPMQWYRAAVVGYGLTHEPTREFLWEICAANSGKTTFVNTLKQGLGSDYIRTIRREALRPDRFASASSHSGDLRHLAKPVRFAFVREIQGKLDSEIVKAASGGDDLGIRRIRVEDEEVEVTAYLWFMGNPRLRNGPRLDVADDDENTRAILDRAKPLYRDPIPNPDKNVVKLAEPAFRRAALARLVEYTMACTVLNSFPPDLPSNRELLEAQRQTEMEDWQREWVPGVIREKGTADGAATLPACSEQVKESFDRWWKRYGVGQQPNRSVVSRTVKLHHGADTERRYCPSHKVTEHCYPDHVMAQPISLVV